MNATSTRPLPPPNRATRFFRAVGRFVAEDQRRFDRLLERAIEQDRCLYRSVRSLLTGRS